MIFFYHRLIFRKLHFCDGCRIGREISPTFFIMDSELFKTLKALRDDRRNRHIFPEFIPFSEIPKRDDLRDVLNQAYKEGYIKVHRGINQNLIELIKEEYSPN